MAGLQPHLWPDANSSLALGSANDQGPAFASCGYHIIQSEPIPRAAPYMPPTGARTSTQRFVRPSNSGYPLAGRSHGRHVFRPMRASARQAEDRKPETDADVSPAAGKGQALDRQPRRLRGKGSTVLPGSARCVGWRGAYAARTSSDRVERARARLHPVCQIQAPGTGWMWFASRGDGHATGYGRPLPAVQPRTVRPTATTGHRRRPKLQRCCA